MFLYSEFWLIENPLEKLARFELIDNEQRWLKVNSLLLNDFNFLEMGKIFRIRKIILSIFFTWFFSFPLF